QRQSTAPSVCWTASASRRGSASCTHKSNQLPACCCRPNDLMGNNVQPNFDEELNCAIADWRQRHQLREDDAVLLLVELFRIHQRHWDGIRHREMPAFEQFRGDLTKLT